MLYHVPQGSSTPGKPVLPWVTVNILAVLLDQTITTGTHILSPVQCHWVLTASTWIHFHPWEVLLQKWFHHEGWPMFWPFYPIKPWIHSFWAHCSGTQSWLAPSWYLPTHGICYTMDHKAHWHLETSISMNINQYSGHFQWIKPWLHTLWAHYSDTECWLTSPGHLFTHETWYIKDQKAPGKRLEKRFWHKGKSVFWRYIPNQTMNRLSDPTEVVHSADWLDLQKLL